MVANHLNLADPPIVSYSVGRTAIFMAKEELFQSPFSAYVIRNFGAFPVRRGGVDRDAIRQATQWLAKGVALVMFPEGKRSKTAQLQPAFIGSALIAASTSVPILPVGITGTEHIKGAFWWLRRPKVTINIGKPFRLTTVNGKPTKAELNQLTDSIMTHIAELLPVEYRGNYAVKREANEN